jgi:hypothetical protein
LKAEGKRQRAKVAFMGEKSLLLSVKLIVAAEKRREKK